MYSNAGHLKFKIIYHKAQLLNDTCGYGTIRTKLLLLILHM